MKKTIIFGCTVFSRQLCYCMEKEYGLTVEGFCLNREYYQEQTFYEKKVYIFEDLGEIFPKDSFEVLITAGYRNMNKLREKIFNACDELGYSIGSFIQPGIRFEPEKIGRGNIIADNSTVFPFASIGDGNIIVNSDITHDSNIGNFNFISSATIGGCARIENNCFIGINAGIGDGVHVGNQCLIGGGVFLSTDVGDCTLVSPSTPRIVKSRPELLGRMFKPH